jgi:glycosyltransferase involved in cell wall biosynthesis
VVVVARLRPEKRHTDMLKALALMQDEGRDVHAIFVGDGPCEAELRREAAQRRLRVSFAGFQEDPSVHIAASDVVCLSSAFEALPMSLIEAAAAGRATVATNVGGTREIVRDGVTGLVVPARDARALADALARLSHDADLRALMGRRAKKMWEECFSFDAMVDAYLDLLSRVTGPPVGWGARPVSHGTG